MAFIDIIMRALVGLALVGFFSVFCLVWMNKRLARDVDRGYSNTFEPREKFNSSAKRALLASDGSLGEREVSGDVVVIKDATQHERVATAALSS